MNIFKLPDLGEGLIEAEIVTWHIRPGEPIEQGQNLVSVETDKAIVDIPSPEQGRIAKLYGKAGDIVQVGDPLVEFEGAANQDTGTVVGVVKSSSKVVKEKAVSIERGAATGSGIKATPAVRALAARMDVELSIVTPTGPNDTITVTDIERVAGILAKAGPMEPLRGVRRAMARTMAQSHAEVVPVTLTDVADIHAWPPAEDVSVRLIQAIVAACKAEPALNAWYDAHAIGRRLLKQVDLGVAVDTADGLFVPVLKDVARYDRQGLRALLDETKTAVERRTIAPEALRGHSFTLSNFGTLAGRHANPIIIPPTVAILGVGRGYDAVVPENGQPAVHKLLPLSLSFDHRAATGGEAARFLATLIASLQAA